MLDIKAIYKYFPARKAGESIEILSDDLKEVLETFFLSTTEMGRVPVHSQAMSIPKKLTT